MHRLTRESKEEYWKKLERLADCENGEQLMNSKRRQSLREPPRKKRKVMREESPDFEEIDPTNKYVLCLMIEPDDTFTRFYNKCKSLLPENVVKQCSQWQGTEHFTLFKGNLTRSQSQRVRFLSPPPLPVRLDLGPLKNWTSCLALATDRQGRRRIGRLLTDLVGLPTNSSSQDNLHLSLFRRRGYDASKFRQHITDVRNGLSGGAYGTVKGVKIILKIVGAEYDDCRVIASS